MQSRRAPKACTFCRRRKLKCDNRQPACANCTAYGTDCVYATEPGRPRPSRSRISHLEQENQRLRQQLESNGPGVLRREEELHTPRHHEPTTRRDHLRSSVSRIFISPNGDSSYHGLTSTLFGDAPTDRRVAPGIAADPKIPVEYTSKRLMGEAAIQRQLEPLNFQQGKLDFDGVDAELGMHLLSLHWNRQHHSFLITYRPAFMRDMACGGPYFSKLLLNAIYFGSSKFSTRPEVRRDPDEPRTAGWTFRMRVKELLGDALDRSEITTIQALLVMSSSLFALGDERSAAWLYAGTAFRMITDLGMHVDAPILRNMRRLSDEDLEIRRRVFWGAFVVDKIQSLYQGRPASLQAFDSQVPLTFLDRYEELEHWQPFAYSGGTQSYPGSSAYSISTFTELCKLSVILNSVLNKVYSERSSKDAPEELIASLSSLDSQLNTWHNELPAHLKFCPEQEVTPAPHILSLTALYNVLLILLHRPFVAEGHLHSTNPSVAFESFARCAAAAANITNVLKAYNKAFSIRRAPYLISYATYVAATIHVRVAAQREGGSSAHVNLGTCLAVFDENMETNSAVRRAKNVILHLMDRMGVSVSFDRRSQGAQDVQRRLDSRFPALSQEEGEGEDEEEEEEPAPPDDVVEKNNRTARMSEPSELDMDMIIHSFIRQQGGGNDPEQPVPWLREWAGGARPWLDPYSGGPGTNDPDLDYMRLDEDMLFGFNGSLLDGLM